MSVLLGNGDGTFQNQTRYSAGASPSSVAVGDFNNDTRLDIVVANHDSSGDVIVLFGSVNIAFREQMTLTHDHDSHPRSFVVENFNDDDYMDIVVAYSGAHNIGIFLGYGNTSFSTQTRYSTGAYSSPYSLAVADFNNDTYLDIVVANYGSHNVGIFLGYGNGSFQNQTTYLTDSHPCSVAVGDFDNDGISDIIVANYDTNTLFVFLKYHTGLFGNMVFIQLEFGSHPFSVLVGDFNNDRKLDFTVANNGTDSLQIYLQAC